MQKRTLKKLWALFALGYMGLIFYLSTIPGTEIHIQTPDYILHGLAFGGLSFLLTVFFLFDLSLIKSSLISVFCTFLYGLSDEFHQSFVPFRTPDWHDILADVVGAVIVQIGLAILLYFYRLKKSKG